MRRVPESGVAALTPGYAARHAAIGSLWVWAVTVGLLGLLGGPAVGPFGLLCGAVFGWGGGAVCGWVAALAVRGDPPPPAARELRRMGFQWALGTVVGGGAAFGAGLWILSGWRPSGDPSRSPFELLFDSCFEVFALLLLVMALIPVGFLLGSGLLAGLLRRRLGLAKDGLTRFRVWAVGAAWALTGMATGLLALLSTAWLAEALGLAG